MSAGRDKTLSVPKNPVQSTQQRSSTVDFTADRRKFLVSFANIILLSLVSIGTPMKTLAKEGGLAQIWTKRVFPKAGYNAPESLKTDTVQLNEEMLKNPQVTEGIKNLKNYRQKVLNICEEFKKNPQMEVQQLVRDTFDVAHLRNDLNNANRVFSEETQITTDRFVRNILQDVNELESISGLLGDNTRTPRKIENTEKWLKNYITTLIGF
eukprot:jgi/Galph1/3020/GphlegSOOS_G1667.1